MANKKQNKVYFAAGSAWYFDKNGNRVGVESLDEANNIQSACFGPNSCSNSITLPVNDDDGTTTYPATFEFVLVGSTLKLRVTGDFGSGYVVKEVTLS